MNKEVSHETYYGQFVTRKLLRYVEVMIGRKRIIASQDPYFNDIYIYDWDVVARMAADCIDRPLWCKANGWQDPHTYPWSTAEGVCIAKAAARIIRGDKRE